MNPIRKRLALACLGVLFLSPAAIAQDHAMSGTMDSDGNGSISAAEHAAAAQATFDKADADHDGNLSMAEMHAMHAGMGGHAMAEGMAGGKKMACGCCSGKDGMAGCGMDGKQDPIGDAMSGHAGHATPEPAPAH